MPMMGTSPASARASDRMRRVASKPSMRGISTSISTTSNEPTGLPSNVSSASKPSVARETLAPASSSRYWAISAFRALSSTRRMRMPAMLPTCNDPDAEAAATASEAPADAEGPAKAPADAPGPEPASPSASESRPGSGSSPPAARAAADGAVWPAASGNSARPAAWTAWICAWVAHSNGSITVKVEPFPSSVSKRITPPMASTIFFTMASPRPEPL